MCCSLVEERTMRELLTYNEAALEAIAEEIRRQCRIFYMSTDALPPLLELRAERVRATPITEAALTGMAIGAAGCGFRPIVAELAAGDVLLCRDGPDRRSGRRNRYMFGGQQTFPILSAAVGGGGQVARTAFAVALCDVYRDWPASWNVFPRRPQRQRVVKDCDPRQQPGHLVELEAAEMTRKGPVPEEDYTIPFGQADIKREGSNVTVVALAWLVHEALAAAEELVREESVEIVDPRRCVPLRYRHDPPLGAENRAARHRRRGRAHRRLLG